ncbi:MAG: alpha-amylase family glycosyl hydrolase, partial [Planctomycetaceae bacterium]
MAVARWWQTGVVYEITVPSFQDSNGDGWGDLPGLTQRLDYLRDLGVDVIWLTPINESPMYDLGYDISCYTRVDPTFGTFEDFERLLREAKQRELRVVLDFVPNHTSVHHPWFLESSSSRDNPRRDWYLWADPGPDAGPPNNWVDRFGHSAWTWSETS